MIYTFDTYYFDDKARTACLGILNWDDDVPTFELVETIDGVAEYESGSFYKRELPRITHVLDGIELASDDIIVVDGYVVLDDDGKLGLGGYLHAHLGGKTPIIGVAKNNFATLNKLKREVMRGDSKKPLFLTAMGIDVDVAASLVSTMHGEFRFPTILKLLDQKSRGTG
jgi:deoxyribonuclease V